MKLTHVFGFLVACLTFTGALALIYHDTDTTMTMSGWALISYLCYLIALTGENGHDA